VSPLGEGANKTGRSDAINLGEGEIVAHLAAQMTGEKKRLREMTVHVSELPGSVHFKACRS
jgi:hypothetical protein